MLAPLHARKASIVASRSSVLRAFASPSYQNAVRQAFALIDVEHDILAQHGNDAGLAFLTISVGDL